MIIIINRIRIIRLGEKINKSKRPGDLDHAAGVNKKQTRTDTQTGRRSSL